MLTPLFYYCHQHIVLLGKVGSILGLVGHIDPQQRLQAGEPCCASITVGWLSVYGSYPDDVPEQRAAIPAGL